LSDDGKGLGAPVSNDSGGTSLTGRQPSYIKLSFGTKRHGAGETVAYERLTMSRDQEQLFYTFRASKYLFFLVQRQYQSPTNFDYLSHFVDAANKTTLTRDRGTKRSYFTVRPRTTTPEGSVHSQGSPAGPNPYGQTNLPTLQSRSVNSFFILSKNPGAGAVWRREAGVAVVLLQAITLKHVEISMAQPKQRRKTSHRLVFSSILRS
jgi:hypothetical protein